MAHYIRMVRTPHNLIVYNAWENRGDSVRNEFIAPDSYTFFLSKGALRYYTPRGIEPPQRWIDRCLVVGFDPRDFTIPAPCLVEVHPEPFGNICEAAVDNTEGICLFPLERVFLNSFMGTDLVDQLLNMDGWKGRMEDYFDAVRPTQVDPRTLAKLDGDVSVLDVEVIRNALANDIENLVVDVPPRPRPVEEPDIG